MPSRIYLSAVASELSEARAVAAHILGKAGFGVEYLDAASEAEDGRAILRGRIAGCDGVIQLVGWHYGEASLEAAGFGGPMSHTQYEGEFARRTGWPIGYLVVGPGFAPRRLGPPEGEETDWQTRYRGHVESCGRPVCRVADMDGLERALGDLCGILFSRGGRPAQGMSAAVGAAAGTAAGAGQEEEEGAAGSAEEAPEPEGAEPVEEAAVQANEPSREPVDPSRQRYIPPPRKPKAPADTRRRRSFLPLHDKLPEWLRREVPTGAFAAAVAIFSVLAFGTSAWVAKQVDERGAQAVAEVETTTQELASTEATGRPSGDAGTVGEAEAPSSTGRPAVESERIPPTQTGRPKSNDLLADSSRPNDGRPLVTSRPSLDASQDPLTRYLPAGLGDGQEAFLAAFRALPLRMLDEPHALFDRVRFVPIDDAGKQARAIAELAAEGQMPAATLEGNLRKFASDVAAYYQTPTLDRARAFFLTGRYAEAEQTAIVAVRPRVGPPAPDFFASRMLAAAAATFQHAPDRVTKYLETAVSAAEAGENPLELGLAEQVLGAHLLDERQEKAAVDVLRHASSILEEALGSQDRMLLSCRNDLGVALFEAENLTEGQAEFRAVTQAFAAQLGGDHPRTLASEYNLAFSLLNQDEAKAEKALQRVAGARERVLGREDPQTLLSNCSLGLAVMRQRPLAAQTLLEELADRARRKRGEGDPITCLAMDYLADALQKNQKLPEAEKVRREIARASAKPRGKETDEMMANLEALGDLLLDEAKYAEAVPIFRQTAEVMGRRAGPEAPGVERQSLGLARALLGSKKYSEAETLFRTVWKARGRLYGEQDERTMVALGDIGLSLKKQLKYEEAGPLYQKVLDYFRAQRGDDHPQTLEYMVELGDVQLGVGNLAVAESLFRKALEATEKKAGQDSADTYRPLRGLVGTFATEKKFAEAEFLAPRMIAMEKQIAGVEPEELLMNRYLYGAVFNGLGRFEAALPYLKYAAPEQARVLGAEHRHTLMSFVSLADAWQGLGQNPTAGAIYEDTLEKCERVLGRDDPLTLRCLRSTAYAALNSGRGAVAEPAFARVLQVYEKQLAQNDRRTLELRYDYGCACELNKHYDRAAQVYNKVNESYVAALGKDSEPACLSAIAAARCVYRQDPQGNLSRVRSLAKGFYNTWRSARGVNDRATRAAGELLASMPPEYPAR